MQSIHTRWTPVGVPPVRRGRFLAWVPLLAALVVPGCTNNNEAPPLGGPSELGLSLSLGAAPDVLTLDGLSQSQVTITARDSNGRPARDVAVRVETFVNDAIVDIGRLSSKNAVTGSDGRATVMYTAPAGASSGNSDDGAVVVVGVTPAGTDWANAVTRKVQIRLVPQGIVLPTPFAPVPRFNFSPTDPSEDVEVIFDGSSSIASCAPNPSNPGDANSCTPVAGSIVSYQWDFGDGRTGSGVRPRTFFQTRGTYSVTLMVTNDRGLSNSLTKTIAVAGAEGPRAEFTFSPTAPNPGQSVFFDASASATSAPGRHITTYSWTFGDGGTGSGVTTSRRYANPGTYNVTLTVADTSGITGSISKSVTVGAGLPTPNFVISPSAPRVGQQVFVDASSSTAPSGRTIVTYEWNWGDGTGGSGITTSKVYNQPATYTIVLTTIDSGGGRATISKTVTITP